MNLKGRFSNVEIVVASKDDVGEDHDNKYCAIVMGLMAAGWVNTGIVVREFTPVGAFKTAMKRAIEANIWEE